MTRRTIGYCTIQVIKQLLNIRPNELDKSRLSLGVAEQVTRKRWELRSYKVVKARKACPA